MSSGMMNSRSAKRRRRKQPQHYHNYYSTAQVVAAEERFLQQAIQNSKLDKNRGNFDIKNVPAAPVFFPTVEDFQGNPLDYVKKIRPQAEKYGLAKIVPPPGWNPGSSFGIDFSSEKMFETKHQMLHRLQEGISFGDGSDYTIAEYQRVASERTNAWKRAHYPDHDLLSRHTETTNASTDRKLFTPENLEKDYWNIVEGSGQEVAVEYGNDVDTQVFGSGFPLSERGRSTNGTKDLEKMKLPEPEFGTADYYKETYWNLNNIPCAPDSVLRHVKVGIAGINVPWMYFGSLFTTFCWHNEDNHLYSINYHHIGAPKQWYGVPGTKSAADGLEKVFKSYLSMKMRDVPDLLHHITTMFSPRLLQNANVPVYKTLQYEGEFVITFPRSFHGGFSLGPNIGEAVNFATHDWIAHGSDANERYRSFARPAVFSHDRLTFTMANHLQEQKSYSNCKLLLEELERVVEEELRLRQKLELTGVRDVSDLISLPPNVLDQLDAKSANYDDKRVCHACKHVCFFSAVACECSQSKVSCLRHSHYMCRCPAGRKYFMIWSTKDELQSTLERVRAHCESLRKEEGPSTDDLTTKAEAHDSNVSSGEEMPKIAPGVERDLEMHKNDNIPTETITAESFRVKVEVPEGTVPPNIKECASRSVSVVSNDFATEQSGTEVSSQSTEVATASSVAVTTAPANPETDAEVEVVGSAHNPLVVAEKIMDELESDVELIGVKGPED